MSNVVRDLLASAAWIMCLVWFVPAIHAQSQTPSNSVGKASMGEISRWIAQLDSKTFESRQMAAEKLVSQGSGVREPLLAALKTADETVGHRIRTLLSVLEADEATTPTQIKAYLTFEAGDSEFKRVMISDLLRQGEHQLAFQLIDRIRDSRLRDLIAESNLGIPDMVFQAAINERWDDIDLMLSHKLAWQSCQPLAMFYAKLNGTLEKRIGDLQSRFAENELTQFELKHLVTLLRYNRDLDGALAYCNRLSDAMIRKRIWTSLQMEKGNWETIGQRLVIVETPLESPSKEIQATLAQQAICASFVGDTERFNDAINTMKVSFKKTESEFQKTDPALVNLRRQHLVETLLACLEFERAFELVDTEEDTSFAFDLLSFTQKFDRALQVVGLTSNADERLKWLESKIGASQQSPKSETPSDRDDFDPNLAIVVASHLGSLGYLDEASLHFRLLSQQIEQSEDTFFLRRRILLELVEIESFHEVWRMVGNYFDDGECWYLTEILFGAGFPTADFWFNELEAEFPDPIRRLAVIAEILDSPLLEGIAAAGFSKLGSAKISEYLNRIDTTFSAEEKERNPGRISFHMAMTQLYRNNQSQYRRLLERSVSLGRTSAIELVAIEADIDGQHEVAAEYFDRLWKQDEMPHSAMRAAASYQRAGQLEKSNQRKILALAAWMREYETTNMIRQFESAQMTDALAELLTPIVYGSNQDGTALESRRNQLSNAWATLDPRWSANNAKIALFRAFNSNLPATGRLGSAIMARNVNLREAEALIRERKFDAAVTRLTRAMEFRSGEVDIAENHIPLLDKMGKEQIGNQLFGKVTDYFVELLEQHPNSPIHNNNYAWACASSKRRLKFARQHAQYAASLLPGSSSYLDTLAELEFLSGNVEKAVELSRRCIKINPKINYRRQFAKFSKAANSTPR